MVSWMSEDVEKERKNYQPNTSMKFISMKECEMEVSFQGELPAIIMVSNVIYQGVVYIL